jgi:glycerol-3-phosphate dehydrogenase (NAD(P)+)
MQQRQKKITVLGAGSWGATLALLLAKADKLVSLWSNDTQKVEYIKSSRRTQGPIAIDIPKSINVESDLELACRDANIILLVCTSQSMRSVVGRLQDIVKDKSTVLVSAAKGLELSTLLRMSQIIQEAFPANPVAAISGPNLAQEIVNGLPTASLIACQDKQIANCLLTELSTANLRLYASQDIIGAELGGSLKNIIAIASGASDGLKMGINAKSALITRGLAEITRLAVHLGAKPETLSGLAGMGDLIATCSSNLSRNYRLGYDLARGGSLSEVLPGLNAVAEGVSTTMAVCDLSEKLAIDMPIAKQVRLCLQNKISPKEAISNLMNRPLGFEHNHI